MTAIGSSKCVDKILYSKLATYFATLIVPTYLNGIPRLQKKDYTRQCFAS